MASTAFCVAVAGTISLATAVRLAAAGTGRLAATSTLAFALPRSTGREAMASVATLRRCRPGPAEPEKPGRRRRGVAEIEVNCA